MAPQSADQDIAARLRNGDEGALESLFLTYYPRLCTFASAYVRSRTVSEDLVSDVFLRIWARREEFHPQGTVEAYLYRAIRNRAADYARDERRLQRRHEVAYNQTEIDRHNPDTSDSEDPAVAKIWQAIAQMPPERRLMMILRWQYGKSFAEIADVMGMSRPAVQMQVGRAIKALRQLLGI